ncbi:hypothetical protein [Thermomonas paludicola]|uniref:hypothetical protein n=1 Tax=Thermomonas paludicola TaxID=2884874 RepID=UPI002113D67C|nr:hypothetical protein [Thermomonas paludicola]
MTTHSDIFIKAPDSTALAEFSARAFQALGVLEHEERESGNYVEGLYFCSVGQDPELEICYSDDERLSEYRFWLPISANSMSADTYANQSAMVLAELGYECFVPTPGWARKDWDGGGSHFTA